METDRKVELLAARSSFEQEVMAAFRSDTLELILLPTEQCNFRCTYCYETFEIGRMNSSVVDSIKRLIDRRIGGLRLLSISWFGGEPLLALPVVEDISRHIMCTVSGSTEVGYSAGMTTNGYLLNVPTLERLTDLGIREYQISLDGPEPLHDRTRRRINGEGSFRQIWHNLLRIRETSIPVKILLRVHLTPANLAQMPTFLAEVRETFLDDSRFSVFLKPIERLGGPNDDHMEIVGTEERSHVLAELEAVVLNGKRTDCLFVSTDVCYAARPNSFMIRANGTVGKCTVALDDPANAVGRLLPDGRLQIDNAGLREWLRGWETGDQETLTCPYAQMQRKQHELVRIADKFAPISELSRTEPARS